MNHQLELFLQLRPVMVSGVMYAPRKLSSDEEASRGFLEALAGMVASVTEFDDRAWHVEPRFSLYQCDCGFMHVTRDVGPGADRLCMVCGAHYARRMHNHPRRKKVKS